MSTNLPVRPGTILKEFGPAAVLAYKEVGGEDYTDPTLHDFADLISHPFTVKVTCVEGGQRHLHRVGVLPSVGRLMLRNHDNDPEDYEAVRFMMSLGTPLPTCLLWAAGVKPHHVPNADASVVAALRQPSLAFANAALWKQAGLLEYTGNFWADVLAAGFNPRHLADWMDAGVKPLDAARFVTKSVELADALEWVHMGEGAERALGFMREGFTPEQVSFASIQPMKSAFSKWGRALSTDVAHVRQVLTVTGSRLVA